MYRYTVPCFSEPQRRPKKKVDLQSVPAAIHDPDDIVDISYVGGTIPSRSFKLLQQTIGDTDTHPGNNYTEALHNRD